LPAEPAKPDVQDQCLNISLYVPDLQGDIYWTACVILWVVINNVVDTDAASEMLYF